MNATLHSHYALQFLKYFAYCLLGLSLLVMLVDVLELSRRSADKSHIGIYDILHLSVYKLWRSLSLLLPAAIIFTSGIFFLRKLHTNELIALKSAGFSFFQIMAAPLFCVVFISLVNMLAVNYISAHFFNKFEALEASLFNKRAEQFIFSDNGLWLREEKEGNRRTLIYAKDVSESGQVLQNLQVFLLSGGNDFLHRISAKSAELYSSYWLLKDVEVLDGRGDVQELSFFVLETNITLDKIERGVSGPNSLPLGELPQFIKSLEKSGFNALNYQLHMQRTLAEPMFFLAVLVLSAAMLLQVKRREDVKLILRKTFIAVVLVISLYLVNELIYAWGKQGALPVFVAAWVPQIIGICFASGLLLKLEDA